MVEVGIGRGPRALARTPGFTLVAVATLALGIGATTMVYSFVSGVLAASAPPRTIDRQVALWSYQRAQGPGKGVVSPRDFVEWRRRARSFSGLAAFRRAGFNLGTGERAERVSAYVASAGFFEIVEYDVAMGRPMNGADEAPGAPPVVWLGHRFWRERFGGASDVVGRTIALDAQPAVVAGVLAPRPLQPDIVVPLVLDAARTDFDARALFVFGRLRDGATIEQARAEMTRIAEALEGEWPETHRGWGVNTRPLAEEYVGRNARIVFAVLLGAVTAVLLIGCANVANLLVARGLGRQRELAVRAALGATRGRLFRHLLVESAWLSAAGAVLGAAAAAAGLAWLRSTWPAASEIVGAVRLAPRILLFAILFSAAATIVFGVLPAWQATRPHLEPLLREASARTAGSRRIDAWRRTLVAGQVLASVVLLVVSLLLVRSLIALQAIEPGFVPRGVLTARVTLPARTYRGPDAVTAFYERVVGRIAAHPQVRRASATTRVPAAGSRYNPNRSLVIEGRPRGPEEVAFAIDLTVMPGYFSTLGIPLLEGRDFTQRDRADAPLVVIVSRTTARKYFGERSPVGARLRLGDEPTPGAWRTVVGVVGDVRNDDIDAPPVPHVYVPLAQRPERSLTIVARTDRDPAALAAVVRSSLGAEDPTIPAYEVATMEQILEADLADTRAIVHALAFFALCALILAAVGIGSVLAQTVAQRVSEIGIRMALGATAPAVVALVARQTLAAVATGLILGSAAALALGRFLGSVLYQVEASDPATYAVVVAVVAAAAALAAVAPAARAARVDPVVVLKA